MVGRVTARATAGGLQLISVCTVCFGGGKIKCTVRSVGSPPAPGEYPHHTPCKRLCRPGVPCGLCHMCDRKGQRPCPVCRSDDPVLEELRIP